MSAPIQKDLTAPERWTKRQRNEFLDMWYELYPKLYSRFHRDMNGNGLQMIALFIRLPQHYITLERLGWLTAIPVTISDKDLKAATNRIRLKAAKRRQGTLATEIECMECDHKFFRKVRAGTTEIRCPKCHGFDTQPA